MKLTVEQQAWIAAAHSVVGPIAKKLERAGGPLGVADLVSIGEEALVASAKDFDPHGRVPFAAYATMRVRWAMLDGLRDERGHAGSRRSYASGAGPELDGDGRRTSAPYERDVDTGEHEAALACLGDPGRPADDALDRKRALSRLEEAEAALPARERAVLRLRYHEQEPFEAIARRLSTSQASARRRHDRALARLRRRLRAMGVDAAPAC